MQTSGRRWFVLLTLAATSAVLMGGCPFWEILFPPIGNLNANANDNAANANANANANVNSARGDSGLTGKYVGAQTCALCHKSTHTNWSATLHAGALDTLEAIGQGSNTVCIACHTVGFGEEGGFVNRATTNALAGVGCEACHGPARDHTEDPLNDDLLPVKSIAASVCGACHTGEHHPNFEDWEMSRHAEIQESLIEEFIEGTNASSCGVCHSGDVFVARLRGETVGADFLGGKTAEELNPITCAVCHNPHQKTGNAILPEDGRDYQLRFEQVKFTTPTNTIAATNDPTRFNLCGQCHHARNRTWADTSREPHPSDQVNVFFGEMPLPVADPNVLIPSRPSVHLNAAEQCSTCHVFRSPFVDELAPAVSGHTFAVNFEGCVDCHGTAEIAEAKLEGLEIEIATRAAQVKAALDAWAATHDIQGKGALSWEYTSEGGPTSAGQASIPNEIKKARFLYYYVVSGGGSGAHNPDYVREGLQTALNLALTAP